MENDAKNILMQYVNRFALHYGIDTAGQVTFKKRASVMEQLKFRAPAAWTVMSELIEAFIKEDRISNDREKFDKARVLWESEKAGAEHDKVVAESKLIAFCRAENIPVGLGAPAH